MAICSSDIQKIINQYMPKQKWIPISDIQALVKAHYKLREADYTPHTITRVTNYPMWKKRI